MGSLPALFLVLLSQPIPSGAAAGAAPMTVVIDAGHGGADMGAVVKRQAEKDICLSIARRLAARLNKIQGIKTLLVRDGDTYVALDDRVARSLSQPRAIFISLHADKIRESGPHGISIYAWGADHRKGRRPRQHPGIKPLPPPPKELARASRQLAASLAQSLSTAGLRAEADMSDYYVLKNPRHPSVLVELGFLSNPSDRAHLADPAYQERLATTLAKSIESSLASLPATPRYYARSAR